MQKFRSVAAILALALSALSPRVSQAQSAGLSGQQSLEETMSALVGESRLLLFKASSFDPANGVPSEGSFALSDKRDRASGRLLYVVQFPGSPGEKERRRLADLGAEILNYLPNNAFLVAMDSERFGDLERSAEVRAAFRLPKFAKVDPVLAHAAGKEDRSVEVVCAPGAKGEPVAGRIAKIFPQARFLTNAYHHQGGRIVCAVSAKELGGFLDEVAGMEAVLSLLPWEEKILLNDNSVWVVQNYDTTNKTNYTLSATIWNHGITGTGQIACVNDSGALNTSCFFRYNATSGSEATAQALTPPATGTVDLTKKTIAYYVEPGAAAYDTSGAQYHGTHTCGSVLGDNYATLSTSTTGGHDTGDGMAPNAKLVMQDVGDASGSLSGLQGDLNAMFLQAYNAGARIHSDSWGTTASNYDATAMDMDEFTYRNEDFLFVVAMGNSGTAPADGTIGAPATAKSVVSVGATSNGSSSNANNLQDYSRGPVDDGRRKPDVCSPGSSIVSANGGAACGTQSMSGTSMATPTTAGSLVLLRQYFTDGWYPSGTKTAADVRIPSAALMKACLINGAMEMTGTDLVNSSTVTRIPSMDQGWGRTHLENSLYFSGDARRTRVWDIRNVDGLTTGQQAEYVVNVTASTQPLKVHLVWTDPESTTLAAVNLVNNLDLEVVNPAGTTTYKGNVFATGQSTTGGTADVLNNVEGFVLSTPTTGSWTLRVKATSVPGAASAPYSSRQGYALVATYATCTSTIAAPASVTATNNGTTGIALSWPSVSGATGYIVYKAKGASPAAGDYSVLVQQAGTTFTDTKVQGGYTYWYKVRATDNCSESPLTTASSATYTGNCALYPTFAGLTSVTNDLGTVVCDLLLGWSAATSNCPLGTGITYNVYRATTPYFTPGSGNLLAQGITGTSYRDYAVNGLTTYYYVVRAEDSTTLNGGPHNGGNQDTNSVMLNGTPWASTTTAGTFSDNGGDTNAKLSLAGAWRVTNLQNHTTSGTFCYHNAQDGSSYPGGVCAAATTPPLALSAGAQLSYWVRYNMEYQWDGVVTEISTNGGTSWSALTPTPAYPGDFSTGGGVTSPINACNYSLTQTCFNGPSGNAALTAWTQYTHDLSTYSGQTVMIRWNSSSDSGSEFEGFYLDDIQITNAANNDACATRDGQVALDAASYGCTGKTISIQVADYDLRGAGTQAVNVKSGTEPSGETVSLSESPAGSGSFAGTILTTTAAPPSAGQLSVTNGDTITVTYVDADDGHGGTNVTKSDTAAADCQAPVITNVQAINVTSSTATITWTTDQGADSRVTYGLSIPPSTNKDDLGSFVTSHSVLLTGLSECNTYFFSVTSADPAGNTATANNGGAYYTFDTPMISNPTYASSDVPKAIPDASFTTSTLSVPDSKTILDVNVVLGSITHTYDGDLDIFLIAPDGTRVELTTDNGGTGENFTNTVFDDAAATAITAGTAPFTGSFRPEGSLATLNGKTAAGTWTLEVTDDASGDTGTLNSWSLQLLYPASSCGPHATYQSSAAVSDSCPGGGAGNANGYWDAGETVQFSVVLKNDGTTTLTGLTATVTPVTAGVAMSDATATWADLTAGATGTSQSPHFTAILPTSLTCGSTVQFSVSISSAQGSWSGGTFSFPVGQTLPGGGNLLAESFDGTTFPPTNWAQVDTSGTAGNWARSTTTVHPSGTAPHSGLGLAYFNAFSATSGSSTRLYRTATATIPAAATSATLSFWMYHDTAYTTNADRVQPQASTNGTTWTDVGTAVARYDGSTGWKLHTISYNAYIGQAIYVALHGISAYGNDCHVDDVSLDYVSPGGCNMTTCVPTCTNPSAPTITGIVDLAACAQSGVQVSYSAGSPATRHDLYRDTTLAVSSYASGATYNPGDAASHNYVVRAFNTSCFTDSNTVAAADANGTPTAPSITGFADPNACAQDGVQVSYSAGAGATRHDLYRDGSLAVTGYASGTTYNPGDTASHNYVVTGVNGACSTNSGTQAGTDGTKPDRILNVRILKTAGDMTISWDLLGVSVDKYELYRALSPNGPFDTKIGETSGLVDGITVTLASQPANSSYLVRAVKGACSGDLN
jgi:subtilisin-like proprotein convertase family protein/fibronectin type 3 domain-containing protein